MERLKIGDYVKINMKDHHHYGVPAEITNITADALYSLNFINDIRTYNLYQVHELERITEKEVLEYEIRHNRNRKRKF